MSTLFEFLTGAWWPLMIGATAILAFGWLFTTFHRAPISRQRLGELTIAASVIWLFTPILPGESRIDRSAEPAACEDATFRERDWAIPRPLKPELELALTIPSNSAQFADDLSPLLDEPMNDPPAPVPVDNQAATDYSASWMPRVETRDPDETSLSVESNLAQTIILPPPRDVLQTPLSGQGAYGSSRLTAGRLFAGIYLAGIALAVLWLLTGQFLLWRLVRNSRPLDAEFGGLIAASGIRRLPRVLFSDDCRRAMTFGLLRPTVMIPTSMTRRKRRSQLRHVLLHELGHIRQRDAVGQCLLNLAFVFFYFHPLYWLLRKRICFDRELVVDDWAVQQSTKPDYVSDMIAVARSQNKQFHGPSLAMGAVDFPRSQFYRRVNMLVNRKQSLAMNRSRGAVATHLLVMVGAITGIGLSIPVPSALAQNKKIEEYERKIDELTAENRQLQSQLAEFEIKLKHMEDIVAKHENTVAKHNARLADAQAVRSATEKQRELEMNRNQQMLQARIDELNQLEYAKELQLKNMQDSYRRQIDELRNEVHKSKSGAKTDPDDPFANDRGAEDPTEDDPFGDSADKPDPFNESFEFDPRKEKSKKDPAAGRAANSLVSGSGNANDPHGQPAGFSSEMLQLATRYIDAMAEREIAETKLKHAKEQVAKKALSRHEFDLKSIELKAAYRKAEMIQYVAQATVNSYKAELDRAAAALQHTEVLVKKGFATSDILARERANLQQIKARIEILQKIIGN